MSLFGGEKPNDAVSAIDLYHTHPDMPWERLVTVWRYFKWRPFDVDMLITPMPMPADARPEQWRFLREVALDGLRLGYSVTPSSDVIFHPPRIGDPKTYLGLTLKATCGPVDLVLEREALEGFVSDASRLVRPGDEADYIQIPKNFRDHPSDLG